MTSETPELEYQINSVEDLSYLATIKTIKDIRFYDYNPFTRGFKYSRKKYFKRQEMDKAIPDEVNQFVKEEDLILVKELYKDIEPFCKLFINQEFFDVGELKPHTCKVFLYIVSKQTNLNMDFVIINSKSYAEKLNMSINTIYDAIVELARAGIIVRKTDENSIFWINPYVIFKGDRKKIKFRNI